MLSISTGLAIYLQKDTSDLLIFLQHCHHSEVPIPHLAYGVW